MNTLFKSQVDATAKRIRSHHIKTLKMSGIERTVNMAYLRMTLDNELEMIEKQMVEDKGAKLCS